MKLDLDQILSTSTQLHGIATVYEGINGTLKDVSDGGSMFQDGNVSAAYADAVNTLWGVCATTQDALNGSSVVLVNYINACCADDDGLAGELDKKVDEVNGALDEQEKNNGYDHGDLGPRLPDVDPSGDPPVAVPDYGDAEKPPAEGN